MATRQKQLWKRVLESKEAQRFFADHPDIAPNHSLPQNVLFSAELSDRQKVYAELIPFVLDDLPENHRQVAELYLQMAPSEMARELGITRLEAYHAVRRMKRAIVNTANDKRDKLRGARKERVDLDTVPETAARRTLKFTRGDIEQFAYLIDRDGDLQWVDANGRPFLDDVQDILFNLDAVSSNFEALDVEKI